MDLPSGHLCICSSSKNSKIRLPGGQSGPGGGDAGGSNWLAPLERKLEDAGIDFFSTGRWDAGHGWRTTEGLLCASEVWAGDMPG